MTKDGTMDWQALKRATPRAVFAARFPHPFLVLHMALDEDSDISFHTVLSNMGEVDDRPLDATVMPVVKKPSNPFHDRVSVGRATNCDIVISDSSISKLHAHFTEVGPAEALLVDRKSANGTMLNRMRLQSDPVPVRSGDVIVFGVVKVEFVDAGRLWDIS